MTKIKFLLFAALCAVMTLQVTSCSSSDSGSGGNNNGGGIVVTGITVTPTTATVQVGKTTTISALLAPVGATGNITWETSDATVATVSTQGVVTGIKAGTVSIVAKIGVLSSTSTVTVTTE